MTQPQERDQAEHASLKATNRVNSGEAAPLMRDARRGEAVVSERLRLTAADWNAVARPEVRIEGLEPCLPLFGVA